MAHFTNSATLTYNGLTLTSNTVTGELLETLAVTKAVTTGEYTADDELGYVVTLTNSGAADLTGLTLTDDLGGYLFNGATVYPLQYSDGSLRYFVDGALQPAPTVTAGPPLTVTGITVPADGSVTLAYEAVTTAYASPEAGGSIVNTATASGAALAAPVSDSVTLPAAAGANLQILKTLSPAAVSPGEPITYTFLIENGGNTAITAADNVVVSDTFSPILTGIAVTFNGAPWTETANYTYDAQTGVFTTAANGITVPAASFTQGTDGAWAVTPGQAVITVTGTVQTA